MSIEYRIFSWEQDRGVITVEYGPHGSGITVPIAIFDYINPGAKITREAIHDLVVRHRPMHQLRVHARLRELAPSELQVLSQPTAGTISDAEMALPPIRIGTIEVLDTRRL